MGQACVRGQGVVLGGPGVRAPHGQGRVGWAGLLGWAGVCVRGQGVSKLGGPGVRPWAGHRAGWALGCVLWAGRRSVDQK